MRTNCESWSMCLSLCPFTAGRRTETRPISWAPRINSQPAYASQLEMKPYRVVTSLSILLYASSLPLPAFTCAFGAKGYEGYGVLMIGWMSLISLDPRWLANIGFFLLVYWCFHKPKHAPGTSGASILLALASLAPAAACPGGGGAPAPSTGLSYGGWLWIAAVICAALANFTLLPSASTSEDLPPH